MRWTVEGADKSTGKDRVLSIEANTSSEAEAKATRMGLLVSGVYEPTVLTPAEQLEKMVGNSLSASDMAQPPIPPTAPPPAAISYASPGIARSAPDYTGLRIGSGVLMVFAVIYYVGAIFFLLIALASTVGIFSQTPGLAVWSGFSAFISAMVAGMIGGILHAISAACVALRDIACNSFR
jgi:hypothetical protein